MMATKCCVTAARSNDARSDEIMVLTPRRASKCDSHWAMCMTSENLVPSLRYFTLRNVTTSTFIGDVQQTHGVLVGASSSLRHRHCGMVPQTVSLCIMRVDIGSLKMRDEQTQQVL